MLTKDHEGHMNSKLSTGFNKKKTVSDLGKGNISGVVRKQNQTLTE